MEIYFRGSICTRTLGNWYYWEITTDIETLPENSTWYLMTEILGVLAKEVGNLYGNRTWIEYGFRQSKSELGWADFRVK